MRRLEFAVAIAIVLTSLGTLFPCRKGWIVVFPLIITVATFGVQAFEEGPRWQMAPFYLSALFLGIGFLAAGRAAGRVQITAALASLIFSFAGVSLCEALPVFSFPKPTGKYGVGTQVRHLVDQHLLEPHVHGARVPRELMIQIWYPAERGVQGVRSVYRDRRTTSFWTSQLSLVRTNARVDAPIAPASKETGGYPVLLFSPSWSGQRVQNTFQVEELASHGYIIVAMDHPYGTEATVFPDGRVVRTTIGGGEDYSSAAAFKEFLRKANDETKSRASDVQFVLDTLEEWSVADPQGLLTGQIRLTAMGIFGHSLGGTVAIQTCWLDPRLKAALDMDGMVAAESATEGAKKPVLFLMAESLVATGASLEGFSEQRRRTVEFNRAQEKLMKASLARYGGYWLVVAGITHKNFSDSPLFLPLKFLSGAGKADPNQVFRITYAYSVAFFDKYLKQEDSQLLAGDPKDFPEVSLQAWSAGGVR